MASAVFADKPTHFINFPLTQFPVFLEKYKTLQAQLLINGVDCKLQVAPHISLDMLSLEEGQEKGVDIAIQETIDDLPFGQDGDLCDITLSNLHVLGRCIVLDVNGVQELHDDINVCVSKKSIVIGQSREWIPHCTVAQLNENECKDITMVQAKIQELQFFHQIHITNASPARLELVKLGAEKCDGFYKSLASHWIGIRSEYEPPTHRLGQIMAFCCLDKIRKQLPEGDLPKDDEDAWWKLAYHYENNLWFFRHVYRYSSYFRQTCRNKDCNCMGEYSDYSDEESGV